MPSRWLSVASVTVATRKGARTAVTLPENAKRPKYWVIWSGGCKARQERTACGLDGRGDEADEHCKGQEDLLADGREGR